MDKPWKDFPYPNDLVCDNRNFKGFKEDGICGETIIRGWSRSYDCPKCGAHYDYDPFYMAALCEINIDKYPELREKYPCPFTDEYAIEKIKKHKERILKEAKHESF